DPSDSWNYADLAYTYIWANRPAEAVANIDTAMRLDPHYPPGFAFYKGLAQFAQDRITEATKTFEEVNRISPDIPEVALYLAAAYGKSGRGEDAAATVAAYSATRVRQGGLPFVMIEVQMDAAQLWFKVPQKTRLVDGLRAAGLPYNYDAKVFHGQRLKASEIDALA